MNLQEELKKYKRIIDEELEQILPNEKTMQNQVFEAMRYSIFAGGKRLRPILTLKTCELVGKDYRRALPFALAIEMIHTYSLIHDDLPAMDDDNFRRGKLTNHKKFGENIAILAGDGLLNYAYEIMINSIATDKESKMNKIYAFEKIANAAGVYGMIGGQVVDVLSENCEIDEKTIDYIHKNKTSALIEASISSGAIVGGASNQELEALKRYSQAIGLGYQIRDDILDKIGDSNKLGKDIGKDEENNKFTYLSAFGIENSIKKTQKLRNEALDSLVMFKKDENLIFFQELCEYLVDREN